MTFKENEESLKWHLASVIRWAREEPQISPETLADRYVKNEISMEYEMEEFYQGVKEVQRKNDRILRAIKSIRGKTFYKHLLTYITEAGPTEYNVWQIVRQPEGRLQKVSEYGRAITKEWVQQWSVGMEGDSFEGIICIELKPGRYLKFHYSC